MCVCVNSVEDLPVKPQKEWVHMDKLEPEKLEWMRDLPAPRRKGTKTVEREISHNKNKNKKHAIFINFSSCLAF